MNVRRLASRVASRYLLSKDRYERETGQRLPRWKQKLDEYEERGNFFIRFADVPRLVINPNNEYGTPTGIYTYPLKYEKIKNPDGPFFGMGRPYGMILALKPGANILRFSRYTESDLQRDIAKLREKFSLSDENIEVWKSYAYVKSPAGMIWSTTEYLSERLGGNSVHRWAFILWKTLGYDGAYDDRGAGIIHPNEPYQAVFFNTKAVELEDILQFYGDTDVVSEPRKILSDRDLSGQDFSGRNLRESNLSGSNLIGANLSGADLRGAILHRTNLSGANLRNTNFTRAILVEANLKGANLDGSEVFAFASLLRANLSGVNLSGVNLRGADLERADLSGANLSDAILAGADLTGADLTGAKIEGANLDGAKGYNP